MASRIGNGNNGGGFIPPAGLTTDTRMDQQRERMIKELAEMELTRTAGEGAAILDHVVTVLRRNRLLDAGERVRERVMDAERPPPTQGQAQPRGLQAQEGGATQGQGRGDDLGRLVSDFQRQNGLPVTGRLDRETVGAMHAQGMLSPTPAPTTTAPSTPQNGRAEQRPEPAPRAQPRPEDREATRRLTTIAEQGVRTRIDQQGNTPRPAPAPQDRKSTRLNSSHRQISYADFCSKKKTSSTAKLPST